MRIGAVIARPIYPCPGCPGALGGAVSWTTVRSVERICTQACCITARTGGGSIIATAGPARHRGGIGIQDLPDPAQQRGEKLVGAQMGQRRVGNRPDIAQLGFRPWRERRRFHDERITSPHQQVSGLTGTSRAGRPECTGGDQA